MPRIGRSVCHVLSDYGAKIAVVDLGIERCNAVAKEVNDCHGANSARAYECDVKDMAQVQKTTDTIAKDFGKIDFLINCAGINGIRTLLTQDTTETTISAFQNVLEVNLTGTLRFIAACTPYLIASTSNGAGVGPEPDGTSRIVNISSIAGLNTTGGLGYDSSKHGVLAITKGAAAELGPKGVTVNAICPVIFL